MSNASGSLHMSGAIIWMVAGIGIAATALVIAAVSWHVRPRLVVLTLPLFALVVVAIQLGLGFSFGGLALTWLLAALIFVAAMVLRLSVTGLRH